jgi:hypothetical protein
MGMRCGRRSRRRRMAQDGAKWREKQTTRRPSRARGLRVLTEQVHQGMDLLTGQLFAKNTGYAFNVGRDGEGWLDNASFTGSGVNRFELALLHSFKNVRMITGDAGGKVIGISPVLKSILFVVMRLCHSLANYL